MFKDELAELFDELPFIEERLERTKAKIISISKTNQTCKHLEKLPDVRPTISKSVVAAAGNGSNLKNGRHFAASLGLVPKHSGTGGKTKNMGMSKRGDRYLRRMLIQGAQTVINWADRDDTPQRKWVNNKLSTKERNKVAVAVANKNARILWKLLSSDAEFNSSLAYVA